jgi:cell division protein FtsQ
MTAYAPPAPRTAARRSGVPIDPRIRARRVAVTREQGRLRLHRLLAVVGMLAIAGLATGAVFSPLLDVDQVAVTGADGPRAAEVRRAAAVHAGAPLLLVDTSAVEARVEALPWVDHARVVRHLPGTLSVEVSLRVPVAWKAAAAGGVRLVDGRGATVTTSAQAPAGLPELKADTSASATAARVANALAPALRDRVATVVVANGQATLVLVDGHEVRLGAPQQLAAKVRAALAVLGALGSSSFTYLDVSAPSAPVTG